MLSCISPDGKQLPRPWHPQRTCVAGLWGTGRGRGKGYGYVPPVSIPRWIHSVGAVSHRSRTEALPKRTSDTYGMNTGGVTPCPLNVTTVDIYRSIILFCTSEVKNINELSLYENIWKIKSTVCTIPTLNRPTPEAALLTRPYLITSVWLPKSDRVWRREAPLETVFYLTVKTIDFVCKAF